MKKALGCMALSLLLAAPALADTQSASPADNGGMNFNMKGINVNIGGFLAAEGMYRDRNLNSDVSSKLQALPLPSQTGYYQDETRFSARQSRLSILAQGDYNPTIHLAGYYEMDFLGAASTANSNESNSYNPRIRHLYSTADWDSLGLHLLAGQTWSLVTMNNKGITPRNEVTPLTIEAQYVPGFSWARQAQFRIVKDWDKTFWLALSVENPQSVASGKGTASNLALGQAGGGSMTGVSLSNNDVPDVVVKASYDPSWGHFEVFDLVRTFKTTLISGGTETGREVTTNAVGAGIIVPVYTNQLKLQLSGMYGKGIGRYGSGQLSDITVDSKGNAVPLTAVQCLGGLTYDPTKEWTFYSYYGLEQARSKNMGGGYGYGNISGGSGNTLTAGGVSNLTPGGSFTGQVQRIDQATVGTWWKFFQGKAGKMQAGLQYSYTENKYFSGTTGGAAKANDSMVFTSLRYYWN